MGGSFRVVFVSVGGPAGGLAYQDLAFCFLESYVRRHLPPRLARRLATKTLDLRGVSADPSRMVDSILDENPDAICFTLSLWNVERVSALARAIKLAGCRAPVIVGGPEVSPDNEFLAHRGHSIDLFVQGEGEAAFLEVLSALLDGTPGRAREAQSVGWWEEGRIHFNPLRPPIMDLSTIPSTLIGEYATQTIDGETEVQIETMRGCPFTCSYCRCAEEGGFRALRPFPLARCLEEIRFVLEARAPGLFLIDPTFVSDRGRAEQLLEFVAAHNHGSRLHLSLRLEMLDRHLVDLLSRAGVRVTELGLQSTDPCTGRAIRRRNNLKVFAKNFRLLGETNIHPVIQLISGLPGGGYRAFLGSVDFALDLLAEHQGATLAVFNLLVLPGSELRRKAEEFGLVFLPFPPYEILAHDQADAAEVLKMKQLGTLVNFFHELFVPWCEAFASRCGKTRAEFLGGILDEILRRDADTLIFREFSMGKLNGDWAVLKPVVRDSCLTLAAKWSRKRDDPKVVADLFEFLWQSARLGRLAVNAGLSGSRASRSREPEVAPDVIERIGEDPNGVLVEAANAVLIADTQKRFTAFYSQPRKDIDLCESGERANVLLFVNGSAVQYCLLPDAYVGLWASLERSIATAALHVEVGRPDASVRQDGADAYRANALRLLAELARIGAAGATMAVVAGDRVRERPLD